LKYERGEGGVSWVCRVPERGDFQVTWVVRLAGDGGADK